MAEWERRRDEEQRKRRAGAREERILYYADFTDLFTIIKKNWDPDFKACFGNQAELRVYMEKLSDFRNRDAHSRLLLPFEQHLVVGMCGELRQKITLFLSKGGGGPEPERFARIEEVTDSFGNRATGQASGGGHHRVDLILRPGDTVHFRGHAWDPEKSHLRWRLFFGASLRHEEVFGESIEFEWSISDDDISEASYVSFTLVSARPYRRLPQHEGDDNVTLLYKVLPR